MLFHEICASWKLMLDINEKPSLLLKKDLPIQFMIKTLNIYSEALFFKRKLTLSKTTEWLSMSCVTHQEGGFSLLHLFGVVSGTFQPLCHGLFRVIPFFTSNDVTKRFDLQIYYESTSCTKDCKRHVKVRQLKVG